MKRVLLLLVIVSLVSVPMLFAAEDAASMESVASATPAVTADDLTPPGAASEAVPEKHLKFSQMGMINSKMCPMISRKASMEVTNDGSIIILMGNKLMKYDANLNLVKQIEIQMPMMKTKMGKEPKEASAKDVPATV